MLRSVLALQGNVPVVVNKPTLGFTNIEEALSLVINVILGFGVALTIIFLIVGGIQYITSRGDQKAAETARKTLTNAVIGFIIVIGAFTIKTILLGALGAQNTNVTNVVTNL